MIKCYRWSYRLSTCKDYRVAMLSTLYLTVSGIVLASFKAIGQFQHGRIYVIELTELTFIQGRFNFKY